MSRSGQRNESICVRFDAVAVSTEGSTGNRSFVFEELVDVVSASHADDVVDALYRIEAHVGSGLHAAGFVSYEAASGLDAALITAEPAHDFPLLWFGLFRRRRLVDPLEGIGAAPKPLNAWLSEWSGTQHAERVGQVRDLIAAGDTYQVNLTMRQRAVFDGDAASLYHALCLAQPTALCALIDIGPYAICSASPELHFALEKGELIARPMKGTRPRGRWLEEDNALAEELQASAKERAENTMIVDLLRNDLGRVSKPGSVSVDHLWDVERYPTVWQMTSTIRSRLDENASLPSLMTAMFPCGSVTGAPKVRTMQIIEQLEDSPRGIYTGSIGYISPGEASEVDRGGSGTGQAASGLIGMEARFSVAIRTVCIDRSRRQAVAGIGGGITWGSEAAAEYEECLTKARFLSQPVPTDFQLLETIRWEPDNGFWLLERHIERLETSADYFGFNYDREMVVEFLDQSIAPSDATMRVRLTLDKEGTVCVGTECLDTQSTQRWSAAMALRPIDTQDIFLFHKTTNRSTYDRAREGLHEEIDEVVLFNDRGEATETARGNLVAVIDGRRVTPPVRAGLLPGTYRAELLHQGEIEEGRLLVEDLRQAAALYTLNSVRRWVPLDLHLAQVRRETRVS